MYTATPPRSIYDAPRDLVAGTGHSPALVVDALRTLIVLRDDRNRADREIRTHSMTWDTRMIPKVDRNQVIPGTVQDLTYLKARRILSDVYPDMDSEDPLHVASTYGRSAGDLDAPLRPVLTDRFVYNCAVLLKVKVTQDDLWLWWAHGSVSLQLAATWASLWDLASLNACVAAGYSADELATVASDGVLPDPDKIAFLAALRGPVRSPF